jgi:hypothetical protein
MRYTVEVKKNGFVKSEIPDCTEKQAAKIARKEAKSNPDCQVFVSWFRLLDGQHGYLNSNGDHVITGRAW